MIDGGNGLSDKYLLDLIDRETRESLLKDIALHEEFNGKKGRKLGMVIQRIAGVLIIFVGILDSITYGL